jgi:ubiquinone/menaquinone biosynthesis C-methylase UbiE
MTTESAVPQIKWRRWVEAQRHEQEFWSSSAARIEQGTGAQLDWYDWKAGQLEACLAAGPHALPRDGKILEIGSGPIGIANSLTWGERFAIDPLETFYRQNPSLIQLRKPGTTYINGPGEELPFPDRSLSLVIIDNVIDHTYAPAVILREILRTLHPAGYLYLAVNVHTAWGAALHDVLAVLQIDKRHPYTFTSRTLRRMLARNGFTIVSEEVEDYVKTRSENRRSPSLRAQIKGWSGLSEFQHVVLCTRTAA